MIKQENYQANETYLPVLSAHHGSHKSFQDLIACSKGEGFIVMLRKNGTVEVYDQYFQILSSRVFSSATGIKAGKRIKIYFGKAKEYYDINLNQAS